MDHQKQINKSIGNISDTVSSLAKAYPDKWAILHPNKITNLEFQREIDLFVAGFHKNGIKKDHLVLLLVKPRPLLFILAISLIRIGAIPVLIDAGMGPKAMAKALLKLKIDIMIGEPKAHILRLLYPKSFASIQLFISTKKLPFAKTYSISKIKSGKWKESVSVPRKPSDKAAIFFTSGSTGPSKAVLYRNNMLQAQIKILHDHYKYKVGEIDCCTFPLTGLLVRCLGLSIVFADMDMTHPSSLKPKKLIRNLEDFGCTHLFCSPMVLRKLSEYGESKNIKLNFLKRVMTSGATIPEDLVRNFRKMLLDNAEILTIYGATEALPISDINDKELHQLHLDPTCDKNGICIGYPIRGIEIKIIPITDDEISNIDHTEEVMAHEVGEIIVKGPVVTQEYLGMENQKQAKIWDAKSEVYWHRMGDLGKKDLKGRLWFFGRKSQRINTAEGLLFTIPIETLFNSHPDVFRTALIGLNTTDKNIKKPVVCVQVNPIVKRKEKRRITKELKKMALRNHLSIDTFLYYKDFPVDPRHNAKIYREKLTKWAQE